MPIKETSGTFEERSKILVQKIEEVAKIAGVSDDPKGTTGSIDYPVVIIAGYGRDEYTSSLFIRTEDDPRFNDLDEYAIDPNPADSPLRIKFLRENTNDEEQHVVLPYGVVTIFGITRSAKSELLKYIMRQLKKPRFIRYMEPETPTLTSPYRLAARVEEFLKSDDEILCIDSLRDTVYTTRTKTATGSGGINMGLYGDLTALNAAAANRKKTIIALINPTTDDDKAEVMAQSLEGAVAGSFIAVRYGLVKFVARTIDNMRRMQRYEYRPENAIPLEACASVSSSEMSFTESPISGSSVKGPEVFGRAFLKRIGV